MNAPDSSYHFHVMRRALDEIDAAQAAGEILSLEGLAARSTEAVEDVEALAGDADSTAAIVEGALAFDNQRRNAVSGQRQRRPLQLRRH